MLSCIFIGFRLYYRRFSHNRFLGDDLDLSHLKSIPIKIKPINTKQKLIQIFMPLFFDLIILSSTLFYIQEGSLGSLITFILFVPIRLFIANVLFANPALENGTNYRITLVDQD